MVIKHHYKGKILFEEAGSQPAHSPKVFTPIGRVSLGKEN